MSKIVILRILRDVPRPVLIEDRLQWLNVGQVIGTSNPTLVNALLRSGYAVKHSGVPA